jgi:hypothetical protein
MAYISKDQKKIIAAALFKVMPKGWKYSLSIHKHTAILLTIRKAPIDLFEVINKNNKEVAERRGQPYHETKDHVQLNAYYLAEHFKGNPELEKLFGEIEVALKSAGWYDRSESQVDHHETAYYLQADLGKFDKPFEVITE